jgi:hypothetical protein
VAIYDVSTLGDSTNLIVFNDFNHSPLFRMKHRAVDKRQIREFDISIPESLGVADYQTLIGKEYIMLEGKMYPNNETDFHLGRQMLRKVANPVLENLDPNADQGYILYKWAENVPKQIEVKVIYVDLPEDTRQGLIQPFRLVCKVRYPVVYSQTSKSTTISLTPTSGVGGVKIAAAVPMQIGSSLSLGATLPFTLPVIIGGQGGISSGTLTNAGDYPTFPVIQIFGPISKPRLTNLATGEYIELQINLNTPGQAALITYDQNNAAVTANGANAYNAITTGSNFFKIYPGPSTFTLTGASVGAGAYATLSFFDAWPLS